MEACAPCCTPFGVSKRRTVWMRAVWMLSGWTVHLTRRVSTAMSTGGIWSDPKTFSYKTKL